MGEKRKWVMGIEEGTCWDEHWVLYISDEPRERSEERRVWKEPKCPSADEWIQKM